MRPYGSSATLLDTVGRTARTIESEFYSMKALPVIFDSRAACEVEIRAGVCFERVMGTSWVSAFGAVVAMSATISVRCSATVPAGLCFGDFSLEIGR